MCGLAGVVDLDGGPMDRELLARMTGRLSHRGPDGEGFLIDDGPGPSCGLGHRRLAIIDLAGGKQPISNEDGRLHLVVNGEFYGYQEQARQLKQRGHSFKTATDSEILLHLYEEEGEAALARLRGMFALALWDSGRRRLLLARDRLGQKPLYWTRIGNRILFASEPKSFFEDPAFDRRLAPGLLRPYLRQLYLTGESTLLRGVRRLLPGHSAVIDSGGLSQQPYWRLPDGPTEPMDEAEATEEFHRLLAEAVKLRLIADVPLGAFLSGGLDSSVICALMAQGGSRPKTFTVSFGEATFDESAKARVVAAHLGTEHEEVPVKADLLADLDELIYSLDEPMADSSAIPTFWLCRATRQDVTVALSGDGGDELLAGYRRYLGRRLAGGYNRLPRWVRAGAHQALKMLPEGSAYMGKSPIKKLKAFLDQAAQAAAQPDSSRIDFLSPAELDAFLGPETFSAADDPIARLFGQAQAVDPVARMQRVDLLTYLPDDILVKVDRMSMAHALEVRSPFLDHHLVEFLAKVPLELKLKGLTTKYLLKQTARRYLPDRIIDQPKQGFEVPLAAWFRGRMRGFLEDNLGAGELERAGLLRTGAAKGLVATHLSGRRDLAQVLWGLLVLELWIKRFGVQAA